MMMMMMMMVMMMVNLDRDPLLGRMVAARECRRGADFPCILRQFVFSFLSYNIIAKDCNLYFHFSQCNDKKMQVLPFCICIFIFQPLKSA